nr:GntR family transcriptional regulator [uncultured Brevundimonas sp.]
MARNRDPFTQAMASLRERLQSGALAGGSPVIVQDEAERLRLSTTPVREALARLSGEGLVERAASGGYVAVRLDAAAARDRWTMHGHYVRIAIEMNRGALGVERLPGQAYDGGDPVAAVSRLFTTLICSAGNPVLWDGFQKVSGQLDLLRRYEPILFKDLGDEAARLFAADHEQSDGGFEAVVRRYHERRIGAAGALAALVFGGVETRTP